VADLGTLAARHSYGVDGGWVCHHNSDGWAYPWPTGGGVADPCWANWPSAGYWLVQHLWEHFRFTRDRQRLNHDWPTIRGAVEFAQHFTRIDSDGWLDTSPSTSPENSFVTPEGSIAAVERASTMDLELLRELFLLVGLAATELGLSNDPIVTWAADSLSRIRPLRIDDMGRIEEWSQDFGEPEPRHRHLSHLWGFFPGSRSRQDGFSSAVAASLDGRGADSTGWSLAWKLALRARIGDAGAISELLDFITRPVLPDGESSDRPWSGGLYPNLFSAHPPFQIDGNLGFTGAFTEALLQSHGDEILLLPALPPELPTGSVRGLVARGRVHVDLKWAGGRLSYAALTSIDCDQSVTIRYAGHVKRAHLVAGKNTRLNF
jgi:alpha-L-fucosidase 2